MMIPVSARPSVVSVRLAVEERERMKEYAAEAGLSVSAYLRQCALEVEQLRAQVKGMMEITRQAAVTPAPAILPVPGFRGWFRRRIFPGKPATTGLTLRA
uniref:Ribbon-helix-helix protein, CopG family n=2 Tax=Paracidobacterium acidisoli TaxID=2303751 RepID=A0A372ILQ5_9BACT